MFLELQSVSVTRTREALLDCIPSAVNQMNSFMGAVGNRIPIFVVGPILTMNYRAWSHGVS